MISPSSFGIHQIPIRDRSRSFRYDVAFWFCCVVLFSVGPGVSIIIIVYWRKVSQENGAILVDFPLNMLLFLASVATSMGAVVSLCCTKMMGVVLARQWIGGDIQSPLLSGHEFAVLASMFSSPDFGALWSWKDYISQRKAPWRSGLFEKFSLSVVVLVLWTNLIAVGSVWFHFTATAVSWSEWIDQTPTSSNSRVILESDCSRPYVEAIWGYTFDRIAQSLPCTIIEQLRAAVNPGGMAAMEGNVGIANTRAAFQTYSNFNPLNAVAKVGNLSFLAPSNPSLSIGYQASTIGMEMQCRFVNQDCKLWVFNSKDYPLDENAYEAGYDCSQASPSFKGYLSGTNATLLSRFNDTLRFQYGSPENPFQLGIGTLNTANVTFDSDLDLNISGNANATPPLGGAGRTYTKYNNLFAMLLCEGAVYNLTYAFRNATYTILSKSLADTNINWLVTAPMVTGSALPFPVKAVSAAMDLATSAATAKANSIAELERFFGEGISQVGIAFASGVFNDTASLQESLLRTTIVSRIPVSVCWFFVLLILVYGIAGVALGILALLMPITVSKSGKEIPIADVAEYITDICKTLKNAFGDDDNFRIGATGHGEELRLCLAPSPREEEMGPISRLAHTSKHTVAKRPGGCMSRGSPYLELSESE